MGAKLVPRVVVLFDGDKAGRAAADRASGTAEEAGFSASAPALPDGHDPDSFIRAHGPNALAALLGIEFPIPDPIGDAFDAWAAAHPEEAAFRLAWPARCDAAAAVRFRQREAAGESMRDLAVLDEMRARAERDRHAAELARIAAERARLVGKQTDAGDVTARASSYLAAMGAESGGAWKAALALVRGFALDEGAALGLLATEYAPRYHRALPRAELIGMVRRASRATRTGYGWLLEERTR
jgi:hypothetical protein